MSDWLSGYVLANGLRLHYTRTGGERPPLVLAHGYSADGLCWAPVARALEADYDIIMVDARGHGRSDAPLSGYGTLSLADAAPVDWPALLPKIACPALLITADNDRGAMVTPEAAREMQGMIGGLEVVHVPGAGHSIRREQFAAYIDAVRGFLARWAAGRA